MTLQNKTALITGASRGLGRHIAQYFRQKSSNLILLSRNKDALELLRKELSNDLNKKKIDIIPADLSNPSELETLIKQLDVNIDILINNAAIQGPIGPFWENDWTSWNNTLQTNLLSPIALCKALLPNMIKRNYGRIINLSGGGATNTRPNFSAYAVSKTGLVRFSEILADEVKSFNITINCIAPGVMNTDMLKEIIHAGESKVGQKEFSQAQAKINTADKVMDNAAELCLFLASNQNKISGKLISAVWDPWKNFSTYNDELANSDIYTLRRIIPEDRGKNWSSN